MINTRKSKFTINPFRAFLLVSSLLFTIASFSVRNYTLDDAFIGFRYAANLAAGPGLVWNVGESPRNEGYTSFLWVLALTPVRFIGANVEMLSKILGWFAVFFAAALCRKCAQQSPLNATHAKNEPRSGDAAAAILLSFGILPFHAVSGMETSLAIALSAAFFAAFNSCLAPSPPRGCTMYAATSGLLLGLTRPDANLTVLTTFLSALAIRPFRTRPVLHALVFYLAGGSLYYAWRLHTFELPFPLPFYLKHNTVDVMLPGARNVIAFLWGLAPLWILLYVFACLLPGPFRTWFPMTVGTTSHIFYFLFPEHIMGWHHRFMAPDLPAIAIASGLTVGLLLRHSNTNILTIRSLTLLFVVHVGWQISVFLRDRPGALTYAEGLNHVHVALGKALATSPLRSGVLAIGDAGAVPYFSGMHTVDTFGLNNRTIALSPRTNRSDTISRVTLDASPDLLVTISSNPTNFVPRLPTEERLQQKSIRANYEHVVSLEFRPDYYLWLMTRPTSTHQVVKLAKHMNSACWIAPNDRPEPIERTE